ncbi:MAG: nucleotidyl transferase AbiEii/AbiGii toxin family protein [Verrucomicrobiota bacterium]|nr:nucleotidyl transferase AbiEii/AbiGii toxin family protein [Verrucomicrobiota bacterium]
MKDHLQQLTAEQPNPLLARCLAREYLQARVLQTLQYRGAFQTWAFQGGTALRFLYGLPRFSEDLDFSLEHPSRVTYFREHLRAVAADFAAEGYAVRVTVNDRKTVHSAFIHFAGLPFALGLSPHRSEVLSVKLELDTSPPAGAGLATSIVRRHVTLHLHHHDRASLLAGKLHALLARAWLKGRDVFDLVWYLSDRSWPAPNLTLLNNALVQTGWGGPALTVQTWRSTVADKLTSADWGRVVPDVRPFLERERDADLLTKPNLLKLLA